ncbi:FAD-binding molybdopterin dehydrogenase [Rhodococcoides trifolii]|uniref:FAD-binding molybdopterin dehydrogenase n=1 Tax=Rhodococcoides trifolii TaxID=908250 RepID=A0A917D7D9_9NOCA|nr:FAD binding domain-containing protein [Rhodococcus trifolii]GGG13004.1 FAD-binding molybdopterin dehydrogenase [Rhodococcus trifolii]
MDLGTVSEVVRARSRDDLRTVGGDTAVVAGATWMMSERQNHIRRLVDITDLGWTPITVRDNGLEIAATCTLTELLGAELPAPYSSVSTLVSQCCDAVLLSFKVQQFATVGGNICLALPAGAMTSLCAALDGQALVWAADGTDYVIPVADLVTGAVRTSLNDGDVLRSISIADSALRARTAFRKVALAPRGRSGAVVIGRVDPNGDFVLTVTAATDRPYQVRLAEVPDARHIGNVLYSVVPESSWYDDVHGDPDWRRHVSGAAAREICEELR